MEFEYPEKCPRCGAGNFMESLCPDCCNEILKEKFSDQLNKLSEPPKPCPFCGLPGELQLDSYSGKYISFNCSLSECCPKDDSFETVEDALKAWNTRGFSESIKENERIELIKQVKTLQSISEDDKPESLALINFKCIEILEKLTGKIDPN